MPADLRLTTHRDGQPGKPRRSVQVSNRPGLCFGACGIRRTASAARAMKFAGSYSVSIMRIWSCKIVLRSRVVTKFSPLAVWSRIESPQCVAHFKQFVGPDQGPRQVHQATFRGQAARQLRQRAGREQRDHGDRQGVLFAQARIESAAFSGSLSNPKTNPAVTSNPCSWMLRMRCGGAAAC